MKQDLALDKILFFVSFHKMGRERVALRIVANQQISVIDCLEICNASRHAISISANVRNNLSTLFCIE